MMKVSMLCLVFASLMLCAFAQQVPDVPVRDQKEFTAEVFIKERYMRLGGGVQGTLSYSWTQGKFTIEMPGQSYTEAYQYNAARGFDTSAIYPFKDQYVFKSGGSCNCMTGVLDHPMPALFHGETEGLGPFYRHIGEFDIPSFEGYVGSDQCHSYEPIGDYAGNTNVNLIALIPESGALCYVRFNDGREIFVQNPQDKIFTNTAPEFATPTDCQCSKPLDICLVVDRSASINKITWNDEKNFLRKFAEQLDIANDKTALSIVTFNTDAQVEISLAGGSSPNSLSNAIENMECEQGLPDQQCTEGFTSISEGIDLCTEQLAGSTRNGSTKVMIVITDGYHNTIHHSPAAYDESQHFCYPDCFGTQEGTQEWYDCAQPRFYICRDDLTKYVNEAYAQIPDLVTYAVGIGSSTYSVSDQELAIITRGDASRIMRRDSFADLANNSVEIVSRTCDANDSPCGDCCGFCVCGTCQAPDFCDDGVYCTIDAVPAGKTCCATEQRPCDEEANASVDKCVIYECYEEQCRPRDKECPGANQCYSYMCEPSTGECVPTFLGDNSDPCVVRTCDENTQRIVTTNRANTECNGGNPCFNYGCNPDTGDCTSELKTPPTTNNVCLIQTCEAGAFTSTVKDCPDTGDICLEAVCDPDTGCLTEPVVCNDSENLCDLSTCDPNATDEASRCVAAFVQCEEYEGGNQCRPRKTGSKFLNGCNRNTGKCEYKDQRCAPQDCFTVTCNPDDGTCNTEQTAGCGMGFCLGEEENCKDSTVCIKRGCDTEKSAFNCDIEEKDLDCEEAGRQADKCLVLDMDYFSTDDTNRIAPGCNPVEDADGDHCVWKDVDCVAFWTAQGKPGNAPVDTCMVYERDSNDDACCVEVPKDCNTGNPCVVGSCENGACIETPLCGPSDACMERSCDDGECTETEIPCVSSDPCFVVDYCDPVEGCKLIPRDCADSDVCTVDACVADPSAAEGFMCTNTAVDCNDLNACSSDTCNPDTGVCEHNELLCDDGDACTIDSCDIDFGCVNLPVNVTEFCNDDSLCTTDTCHPTRGCEHEEIVCTDGNLCTLDTCDPFRGCESYDVVCDVYEECLVGFCDISLLDNMNERAIERLENLVLEPNPNGRIPLHPLCNSRELECYSGVSTSFVIASGLATGAVVGIIVGIVLCFACAGGGIFAATQLTDDDSVNSTLNNPLYKGDGNSGNNPLYKNT